MNFVIKTDKSSYYDPETGIIFLSGKDCIKHDVVDVLIHELYHKYLSELIDRNASVKFHNISNILFWMDHITEEEYNKEIEDRISFIKRWKYLKVINGIIQ